MDAKKLYNDAIIGSNIDQMIIALKHGAQINNRQCRKNTMNSAIRSMLSNKISKFNLEFIKGLVEMGAIPYRATYPFWDTRFDVLTGIIRYTKLYIDLGKRHGCEKEAEDNILELLGFMIREMGCTSISSSTIIRILEMNNERIIGLLVGQKIKINKISKRHILICAIETQNVNIVRLICTSDCIKPLNGPCIEYNVLTKAAMTNQPEIVQEIVLRGGEPHNVGSQCRGCYRCTTFYHYYDYAHKTLCIDEIIYMLMCSGAIIHEYLCEEIIRKKIRREENSIDNKILACYDLLNNKNGGIAMKFENEYQRIKNDKVYKSIVYGSNANLNLAQESLALSLSLSLSLSQEREGLRRCLIKQMDDLMHGDVYRKRLVNLMEQSLHCVPTVCIEIIYDYQHIDSNIKFIDWLKY